MKLSERYFAKQFDSIINTDGCVIADPEWIKRYGEICKLEARQEALSGFTNIYARKLEVLKIEQQLKNIEIEEKL